MESLTPHSKLEQRGIAQAAETMHWRPGEGRQAGGWVFSILDTSGKRIARRWKNYDSGGSTKTCWLDDTKASFYHIGAPLKQAIADAGGLLYIVNGEPAVLTIHAADRFNVLSFFGETSVPETLIAFLGELGVTTVRYYPDKDKHGERSALKLRDELNGSGIVFDCRVLPDELPDKGDTNDLWQLLNFDADAFWLALDSAPVYALPAPEPVPTPRRREAAPTPAGDAVRWDDERAYYWKNVVLPALDSAAPALNGKGRKYEYRHCPNPAHADNNPSFRISTDKAAEGLPICTCGVQDERDPRGVVASWLGLPDFMTWWKTERAPLFARADKAKRDSKVAAQSAVESPALRPFELKSIDGDINVNLRYISEIAADLLPTEGALIVKSPMGTGKTRLAARMIAHLSAALGRSARVLVITHRQALAHDLADRLNKEGLHFECYKGLAGSDLRRIDRLVICANSVPKLIAGIGAALPIYDAILIDESEQVLDHFGGATFRKGAAITAHETIRALTIGARLVVAMDAHAGERTHYWLTEAGKQPHTLVNHFVVEHGALTLYDNREALVTMANRLIDERAGVVVIPTSSKREAKRLYRYYTDRLGSDAAYMICSDNSEGFEAQAFIRDINARLPLLRVFIYTTSLGTGIDITCPVRAVCGVFGLKPLGATEIHQMIGRCRQTAETHVFIKAAEGNAKSDPEAIYSRYIDNAVRTMRAIRIHDGVVSLSDEQLRLTRLNSHCEADRNRSANNLRGHFVALAAGYLLTYAAGGEDEALRMELSQAGESIAADDKELILTVDPVSYEEYDQKRQQGELTPEIRAGLERYRIEDTSGQTINPPLYDELHTPEARTKLVRFTDLTDTDAHMLDADRAEHSDNVPYSRRKHRTMQRRLGRRLLKDVFGDVISAETKLTGDEIADSMKDFLEAHTDDLHKFFGMRPDQSHEPTAVLSWVLNKRYGLKLVSRQNRIGQGKRVRVYSLDPERLNLMSYNADARRAHLERQRLDREGDLKRGDIDLHAPGVAKNAPRASHNSILPQAERSLDALEVGRAGGGV